MRGKALLGLAALAGLGLLALSRKAEAEERPPAPPSQPQPPPVVSGAGGAPHHGGIPTPAPMAPPAPPHTARHATVAWNEFRIWAVKHGLTIPEAWAYYRWLARRR